MAYLLSSEEINRLEDMFRRSSELSLNNKELRHFFHSKRELSGSGSNVMYFKLTEAASDDEAALKLWFELYYDNHPRVLA